MNLGIALEHLGNRETGTTHLEEAVTAYRAALEEETRERVPLVLAITQVNLGSALEKLGERSSGTTLLGDAQRQPNRVRSPGLELRRGRFRRGQVFVRFSG
jgi:hypothetical protein